MRMIKFNLIFFDKLTMSTEVYTCLMTLISSISNLFDEDDQV